MLLASTVTMAARTASLGCRGGRPRVLEIGVVVGGERQLAGGRLSRLEFRMAEHRLELLVDVPVAALLDAVAQEVLDAVAAEDITGHLVEGVVRRRRDR
jgi:hypothetical protein